MTGSGVSRSTLASRMAEAGAVAAMELAGDQVARVIVLTQVRHPAAGEDGAASVAAGAMVPEPYALLHVAREHLNALERWLRQ